MLTYQDCVEHLITSSFGGPQDAEQKDIRTAIQRAYAEVSTIRDWEYFNQQGRIYLSPSWIGSVTYVASTRTLTKQSGDPFPTDAVSHRIRVGDYVCGIATRVSGTQLVLDSTLTLPGDIPISAEARMYRSVYPLPADFRNIDAPVDETGWTNFMYVSQDVAMKIESSNNALGPPYYWTVVKDPNSFGYAIKILMDGYPIDVDTLDFTYRRSPRQMRLSGHEAPSRAGTVSVAGTSVTGTGTAFASTMVGSVLRLGTSTVVPDTLGSMNPYADQARVVSVASATSLVVDKAMTASGVKYVITDPVDMPPGMHNCLLSACEYWLARTRNAKPDNAFSLYQRDLRLAMENDQVAPLSGSLRIVWDAYGWRTPLQADDYDGGSP
jgi:hypothetical protein